MILLALLLFACDKPVQQYDYTIFSFGTLIDVTLYNVSRKQADTAFEQLQQMFDKNHQDWSPWTNGDLAQLNENLGKSSGTGDSINVPGHLVPILKRSIKLSELSNNYYNPAIGNLINLWQFHKYQDKNIKPPPHQSIQDLIDKHPQMSNLSFNDRNQLVNTNTAISLNFGAFAKGYAIGLGIKKLQKLGISDAIINAGGDLSVIGRHGDRAWNIGIRHPRKDSILASIKVKTNESVFTSGDYERYYFYQSVRYHHILDPETGYPTKDAQSVTVLHPDPGLADAAATALFVAGSKNWQSVARQMGIEHVMLIDASGNIQLTAAMEKRVKFLDKSLTSSIFVSKQL